MAARLKQVLKTESSSLTSSLSHTGHDITVLFPLPDRLRGSVDPWSIPRSGERVSYVIACGEPGATLYSLVREPGQLLVDPQIRLHTTYYVTKVILPPLHR